MFANMKNVRENIIQPADAQKDTFLQTAEQPVSGEADAWSLTLFLHCIMLITIRNAKA